MRAWFLFLTLLAGPVAFAAPPSTGPAVPPQGKAEADAPPGPSPSRQGRQLSRALVPQKTWNHLLDRSAEGLSSAVARTLSAKGEKVPSDLQATVRKELGRSMKYDEAVDAQAQALQKRFTAEELEEAAKFYESPLGKKMLDQLPAAQGEVGDHLQDRLASVVPDIIQRVAPSAFEGSPGAGAAPPDGTGAGPDGVAPDAPPGAAVDEELPPGARGL